MVKRDKPRKDMKESGEKLGVLLASDEVERLNNIVKRGTARQALMAKAILQWERGYTIANSAKEIGRARATISIWRKNFTIYGFQVFHDGTTRTDLQLSLIHISEPTRPY